MKEHFLGGEAVKGNFWGGEAMKEHFLGEGEGVKKHFCCLFSWAPRPIDFLINSLYGKQFFHPSYGGPRLWQQGMHEIEKVPGSGSRACVKLRQSQALAAGHA